MAPRFVFTEPVGLRLRIRYKLAEMKEASRERLAGALQVVGLLGPTSRLRQHYLALRGSVAVNGAGDDGPPLPPASLRVLVDGRSADAHRFLRIGEQSSRRVRQALAAVGVELEALDRVLDFGCGCGRVARHWSTMEGPEIHGCDHNPRLAAWCERNLPFMRISRNDLAPPTEYADDSFDLIYALSVFTHLPESLQMAWMAEFRRILRPGGTLLFTTFGDRAKPRLGARDRADFESGRLVVKRPNMAGSNLCIALHPYAYVTNGLLGDLSLLSFMEASSPSGQDTYVARR